MSDKKDDIIISKECPLLIDGESSSVFGTVYLMTGSYIKIEGKVEFEADVLIKTDNPKEDAVLHQQEMTEAMPDIEADIIIMPPKQKRALDGRPGQCGGRGGFGYEGGDGGSGEDGYDGKPGQDGADGEAVVITIHNLKSGLIIANYGGDGQQGGNGGKGGDGGAGGDGMASGKGGRGGSSGKGGNGGDGGNGGKGGAVTVKYGTSNNSSITAQDYPGQGGAGGVGGDAGLEGRPGCNKGKEFTEINAEKASAPGGDPEKMGKPGKSGQPGAPGKTKIKKLKEPEDNQAQNGGRHEQ